jgi:hypothetical protein
MGTVSEPVRPRLTDSEAFLAEENEQLRQKNTILVAENHVLTVCLAESTKGHSDIIGILSMTWKGKERAFTALSVIQGISLSIRSLGIKK